jgi:hypothetical protein
MRTQVRTWAIAAGAAVVLAASASAQYSDNFESYASSSTGTLFGFGPGPNPGGWREWDGSVAGTSKCYNSSGPVAPHSGSHCISTEDTSDTIQQFTTFTSGHWDLSIWTYVPGPASSNPMQGDQWLVLLNFYADLGVDQWATQLDFDPILGEVRCDDGYSLVTNTPQWGSGTTLTFDAWKEVKVDIDLTADVAQVFYDGTPLGDPFTWSLGPFGNNAPQPAPAIQCIDLYANDGAGYPVGGGTLQPMFWDDLSISVHNSTPPPTTYCTVGHTNAGCVPAISFSGTPSATAASGFSISVPFDAGRNGTMFYGVDVPFTPVQWGPGGTSYLCVKAPTQRMGALSSGGSTGCTGLFQQDWNAFRNANPAALGSPFAAGQTFDLQCWGRDPASPKTTLLSQALKFTLAP